MTLSRSTKVAEWHSTFCQLPGHALTALFQAAVISKKLTTLSVYDDVRLQGQDRDRLLQIIPKMNLACLHVNLDFTDDDVLSSFHKNASIRFLFQHNGIMPEEITNGPVSGIMRRNNRLDWTQSFMKDEGEGSGIIPWTNVITRFSGHESGLSAVYTILRKKLPSSWWLPETQSPSVISPVAAAAAATIGTATSSTTAKRSHMQATLGDDMETAAKSSILDETQQKRPRCPSSPHSMLKENEKEDGAVQQHQERGSQVDTVVSTYLDDEAKSSPALTDDFGDQN